jgi:excisionase family DNA binding protein
MKVLMKVLMNLAVHRGRYERLHQPADPIPTAGSQGCLDGPHRWSTTRKDEVFVFRSGRCVVTIASSAQRKREGSVDLLSIPEAARRIGVHADTLYRLCRTGQFPPAIQIGRGWRVSVPRLDRYLHGDETGSYPETDPDSLETAVDS